MKRFPMIAAVALLAGCQATYTPEGCKVRYGQLGAAQTRACIAAYHEQSAREDGQTVTRCYDTSSGVTCATD